MREPLGHPELPVVVARERHADPLAERGRVEPDVDGDVVDLALEDAHELSLAVRQLVVQAAQDARHRVRDVVLHEVRRDSRATRSARRSTSR